MGRRSDKGKEKPRWLSVFSTMSIGYLVFGVVWLSFSVFMYNLVSYVLEHDYLPKDIAFALPEMQKILINLIKFVITPCILLSFMVYLLYWVLCFIQWYKDLNHQSEDKEPDEVSNEEFSDSHNLKDEHNTH